MKSILVCLIIFTSSCSTVRYRYEADIEIKKKDEYSFVFEKNYPTTKDAAFCALTFWAYGGWCWMYIGKPTSNDMDIVSQDADRKVRQLMKRKKLGKYDFEILGSKVSRSGWGWDEMETTTKLSSKYYNED